jgi:glycine/D-amino acid oxidase-like deaminating enzyme
MRSAEKSDLTPTTAVVVGAGIIGLACATELQRRGIATAMLDPAVHDPALADPAMLTHPLRGASWGNAGHLATEQVEPLASPRSLASLPRRLFSRGGAAAFPPRDIGAWLPFGIRLLRAARPGRFIAGTAAMRSLLADALPAWRRLATASGCETLLVEDGHYIVWESAAGARTGRNYWASSDIGGASFRDMTQEEVSRIATLIGRIPAGGLRFSGTARVRDPGELHESLTRNFTDRGGTLRRASIAGIETRELRASLRLESGETLAPDLIVVAAGVGSAALLRPLGHRAPIIAERGYHIQAQTGDWPDMPPVVFEERSMIVSRFNSGLRAASFVEFARASTPPDPRKWQRLRAHAADLRLPLQSPVQEWMGARPTLPDYLPAIGRSRRANNLLYAFGHHHLGLTLAAVTGELIGSLASGEPPRVALEPFALERFS